ncbi:MAG: TlpA family protein disulfide reductase [Bacteroidales bacterium]|nr:TlpA family protein disulfide reductase [Bacteroidales bacterium]
MRMFDDAYAPFYKKYVYSMFGERQFAQLDSSIKKMEGNFLPTNNTFLDQYIHYKIGNLRHFAHQQKALQVSNEMFAHKPVLYNHVAYQNLFNQVYDKYFVFFGRTESGKKIYQYINDQKSYDSLYIALLSNEVFKENHQLAELVILKNLHDEFYNDKFSRGALLTVLDSLEKLTAFTQHKQIAREIKQKITRLMQGYAPPAFNLYDKDSNLVSLNSLHGKYLYLNFCNCASYACIQEFASIKNFLNKYNGYVNVVTIVADADISSMTRFLEKYSYPWLFLHYANNPDIFSQYDIRAFPTYYLISPNGKLAMSPAPSPTENMATHLFQLLQQQKGKHGEPTGSDNLFK